MNNQLPVIEVCQKQLSALPKTELVPHVRQFLSSLGKVYEPSLYKDFEDIDELLAAHVEAISLSEFEGCCDLQLHAATCKVFLYQLNNEAPSDETDEGEEEIVMAQHWILPSGDFEGIWQSLEFDASIKENLLSYAATTLLFSDRQVDSSIISWNRVVLLHGPPGTGKTSLCKALAQKLSIRLSDRFSFGVLVEINSHSLFSKWFSESGKLVMKMFQKIFELVADESALVCVLIDEVESLAAARKSASSGTEPSDAIRVVNALLTQIDKLKRFKNVLVFTTSNITGTIDLAFVDRADIKQYIGHPSLSARYKILHGCVSELCRTGIVHAKTPLLDLKTLELMQMTENELTAQSLILLNIARKCEGFSGRCLRKLPFLAHAIFLQTSEECDLVSYLEALDLAVCKETQDRALLSKAD